MPNTLYRYSSSLGMVERSAENIDNFDEFWSETKDEAIIKWYRTELNTILKNIDNATENLRANRKKLEDINEIIAEMKDKYPEEFI